MEILRDCYCIDTTYWPNALNFNTAEPFVCKSRGHEKLKHWGHWTLPPLYRWTSATRNVAFNSKGSWVSAGKNCRWACSIYPQLSSIRWLVWFLDRIGLFWKVVPHLFWPQHKEKLTEVKWGIWIEFRVLPPHLNEVWGGGGRRPNIFLSSQWVLFYWWLGSLVTNTSCSGLYSLGLLEQEVLKMSKYHFWRKRSCNGLRV